MLFITDLGELAGDTRKARAKSANDFANRLAEIPDFPDGFSPALPSPRNDLKNRSHIGTDGLNGNRS